MSVDHRSKRDREDSEDEDDSHEKKVAPPPAPLSSVRSVILQLDMAAFANQRPSKVSLPLLESRHDGQGADDHIASTKNVLVLDLDETLVTTESRNGRCFTMLRPGLVEFLREVNQLFEVVYWTAGHEPYGRAVLNAIERGGEALDGKPVNGAHPTALFNQHMDEDSKSLYRLGRPVQQCFLLDDRLRHFRFTPRQALLAEEFYAPYDLIPEDYKSNEKGVEVVELKKEDTFLERILPMLRALAKATSSPGAATREMDHWRPEGYHELDDVSKGGWNPKQGRGRFTPQRNAQPIPRLSEEFYTEYAEKGKILSDSHVSHNETVERRYPVVWASVTLPDRHEELLDLTGMVKPDETRYGAWAKVCVSNIRGCLRKKFLDNREEEEGIFNVNIYPPSSTKPSRIRSNDDDDDTGLVGHEDLEQSSKEKPYQVVIELSEDLSKKQK